MGTKRIGLQRWTREWGAVTAVVVVLVLAPGTTHGQNVKRFASALREADRLHDEVTRLHGEGKYTEAILLTQREISLRELAQVPEHPRMAEALHSLAALYYEKGEYERAEPLYQHALAIQERALGPEHQKVGEILTNFAALRYARGDYSGAEALQRRALGILEKALGPEHPDVATVIGQLAALSHYRGDVATAEQMYQRVLAIQDKALGPEHPNVARTLASLAGIRADNRDYANAEQLYRRALVIQEKALRPGHPEVASTLHNLAGLYFETGNYGKAESLYHRALAVRENALGPEHPKVASTVYNLAILYATIKDYARAESLYRRAINIMENALGQYHGSLVGPLKGLARLYENRWDYAQAEQSYRRALAIQENVLGSDHRDVALTLIDIAFTYKERSRYVMAEPLFRRALAIEEKSLGSDDLQVAFTLSYLASVYEEQGDYREAEPLYQRSLAIRQKALGPNHSDVAVALNNLGALYDAMGDSARAESLYRRALATWKKSAVPEHPCVSSTLANLALIYTLKGQFAEAELLYLQSLSIAEKTRGPEHPNVTTILSGLAELYSAKGDYAKAESLCRRVLAIREEKLGPNDPHVALSLNNLAGIFVDRGDNANAEELYLRSRDITMRTLGPKHPNLSTVYTNLARLFLVRGEPARAIQAKMQAAAIIDQNAKARLATGSDEQKRAYMSAIVTHTHSVVSLHVQAAPLLEEAKQLALLTILRYKGRGLDAMSDGFAAVRRHLSPAEREILDRLKEVTAEYAVLSWRGPGSGQLGDYRLSLDHLDDERQNLEAEMSRRSSKFQTEFQPVSITQVQAAIPEGAALVELFRYKPFDPKARGVMPRYGNARYVAYVLRRGGDIAWLDLGEGEPIEKAVRAFLSALRRPATDPEQAARALDALVMQPIRPLLGEIRSVFLSPDGPLNLIPFGGLRDEDGHYLVERYALTYLTSGRDLVRFRAASLASKRPVVIAAPDFGIPATQRPAPVGAGQTSSDMGPWAFAPLPLAAEEGRSIGQSFPSAVLLMGTEATESAVKALHGPRLLHIATHGFFLPDQREFPDPFSGGIGTGFRGPNGWAHRGPYAENPLLRSGLVFAGVNQGQSGDDDGVLTALEASQLDLDGTKLVVLSACETAVGEVHSGDGVYGLRRALVMAGAETQVMSLWRVNDAATRELMEGYYDGLLRGGGRGEALRQVQLAMLARPERSHPYYWASFIASGNPASLDGRSVMPDFAMVPHGPGSCHCYAAGGHTDAGDAGWLTAMAAVSTAAARRRRRARSPDRSGSLR